MAKTPKFTPNDAYLWIGRLSKLSNQESVSTQAFISLGHAASHIRGVIEQERAARRDLLKHLLIARWIYTGGNPRKMADINDMAYCIRDPYAYGDLPLNRTNNDIDKILQALLSGDLERAIQEKALPYQEGSVTCEQSQEAYDSIMEELLS